MQTTHTKEFKAECRAIAWGGAKCDFSLSFDHRPKHSEIAAKVSGDYMRDTLEIQRIRLTETVTCVSVSTVLVAGEESF